MNKAVLLSLMVASVALAGCADEPPHGYFIATTPAADYSTASIVVEATPAVNPYGDGPNETGQDPCEADQITENDPTDTTPECQEAFSRVYMQPEGGAVLPKADDNIGYTMYIVTRDDEVIELGPLDDHGDVEGGAHYDFDMEFPGQDFTNSKWVQIRFGETIVATARPGFEPIFTISEGMENITAEVTFDAYQIDITMSGVPAGTPLVGWLVDIETDPETGEQTKDHAVEIFIGDSDQVSYTLTEEQGFVGDYEAFHVHVGASSINVAAAPVIKDLSGN